MKNNTKNLVLYKTIEAIVNDGYYKYFMYEGITNKPSGKHRSADCIGDFEEKKYSYLDEKDIDLIDKGWLIQIDEFGSFGEFKEKYIEYFV